MPLIERLLIDLPSEQFWSTNEVKQELLLSKMICLPSPTLLMSFILAGGTYT